MNLNRIESPRTRPEFGSFEPGDAWLAGGAWLFSEPQPTSGRLIDPTGLD